MTEVDRLLEDHKFSPDGSIFEPESLQDIRERLTYIADNECVCLESPHLNALHDLAHDDVPALLRVVDTLAIRLAALEAWRYAVADMLGLGEVVEGHGWICTVNNPKEAAEIAQRAMETAHEHDRDCLVWCDGCDQFENPDSCKRCSGSGCGPGTASGAYEPCRDCDGDGRDHAFGYVNPGDAGLTTRLAAMEQAVARVRELLPEVQSAIAAGIRGYVASEAMALSYHEPRTDRRALEKVGADAESIAAYVTTSTVWRDILGALDGTETP